jgi:hypothetical protein
MGLESVHTHNQHSPSLGKGFSRPTIKVGEIRGPTQHSSQSRLTGLDEGVDRSKGQPRHQEDLQGPATSSEIKRPKTQQNGSQKKRLYFSRRDDA